MKEIKIKNYVILEAYPGYYTIYKDGAPIKSLRTPLALTDEQMIQELKLTMGSDFDE